MKILISSHAFAPSVGGIETASRLLAGEFCKRGHEIVVVTQTANSQSDSFPYAVARKPSIIKLWSLSKWCDVFWQNNLSLRTLWPALILRKPVVVTHQGSYCQKPRGLDLVQRLKHTMVCRLPSVAISEYVASCFKTRSIIIPNPYDASVFFMKPENQSRDGLVFVGRIVKEKGLDILLRAAARLAERGRRPLLTVVGAGPESDAMQVLAKNLNVAEQVRFAGVAGPEEIARILNDRQILVVPSRYDEPFGIVALEGMACGCLVLGSSGGGLPEAIGRCGMAVANGDVDAFATAIDKLLSNPRDAELLLANAPSHLARFRPAPVAEAYLDFFQAQLPA